jgi:hypothetical protein
MWGYANPQTLSLRGTAGVLRLGDEATSSPVHNYLIEREEFATALFNPCPWLGLAMTKRGNPAMSLLIQET